MRRTCRLLAGVKPARYLEPNTPTGLAGLLTHASPRPTLIYLYSSTLDKLKEFPESSLYRASTEAITKSRLQIISSVVPAGYEEWSAKAKKIIAENPEVFNTPAGGVEYDGGRHLKEVFSSKMFVKTKVDKPYDDYTAEWDGEVGSPELEGVRTTEERKSQSAKLTGALPGEYEKKIIWEPEPPLTAEQYVGR